MLTPAAIAARRQAVGGIIEPYRPSALETAIAADPGLLADVVHGPLPIREAPASRARRLVHPTG